VVAVTVGGTFIVVTLAAMRAARELTAGATRLVAAITTAFATGQLVAAYGANYERRPGCASAAWAVWHQVGPSP
jgi:hypothetical protein